MTNDFLNSLYKEEKDIFERILPIYEDLQDVQRLIIRRGGSPKFRLTEDGLGVFTVQSVINSLDENVLNNISEKFSNAFEKDSYSKAWYWDKKVEFAFNKIGKCTPKELIDYVCVREDIGISDKGGRERVSANIYNVISKFNKSGRTIKTENKEKGVVYELKPETPPTIE